MLIKQNPNDPMNIMTSQTAGNYASGWIAYQIKDVLFGYEQPISFHLFGRACHQLDRYPGYFTDSGYLISIRQNSEGINPPHC